MKTLKQLAELVADKESELAYGSETCLLGGFVATYGYVSALIDGDTDLDTERDETEAYELYEAAYAKMAEFEEAGIEYDNDMLW